MLVIDDIRKPSNISGFQYVVRCGNGIGWQASRNGGGRPDGWRGPMRMTPAEAAQDYCDYANGNEVLARQLNTAGHGGGRTGLQRDPEVQAALGVLRDARAQQQGKQGYVYCIGEEGHDYAVKVGYSTNPEARVAELQTGNSRKLVLLKKREGTPEDEAALHQRFINLNLIGEWFRKCPSILQAFEGGQ